ncbi:MAG: right-handed parallel beta-helix repeat-containing protein [Bacteroidales bacterium]
MKAIRLIPILLLLIQACAPSGSEFHVSVTGQDTGDGTAGNPFRTITDAAAVAQPGDAIIVHAGTYRERIDPPRGGTADNKRITYQAAAGEEVVIKGSEVVTGWEPVGEETWKATVPNSLFGDFNPYIDQINGDWFTPLGRMHHTGAVYLNGHWLTEAATYNEVLLPTGATPLWFAISDSVPAGNTTIWAQFPAVDPNEELVEINVRQTVFYPSVTGINYLTIKDFTMEHAATPWAPPTAEQIGLIGTNWSKGWIIEHNTVRYSTCSGIALGKYGDEYDNTSANSAEGYVLTIERALENGWSGENIGHHIVRNNHVSHCEQAGIVGSLGPIFSQVTGNEIHDIHVRRLFSGAEMAAIKFHGAVDCLISDNHIYRSNRGIWLDWMAQGTRVTRNFLHDNGPSEDLFLEVNHGPCLVDHNLFLSPFAMVVNSQGAAYAHNIFAGRFYIYAGEQRLTPHLLPHSTQVAGLAKNESGDERFYNNILTGQADLGQYDKTVLPVWMDGNVYLNGAKPGAAEAYPLELPDFNPAIRVSQKEDGWYLEMAVDQTWAEAQKRSLVTTELLGQAQVPDLPYNQPDGKPYRIDRDYFGSKINRANPFPGPFTLERYSQQPIKVWPGQ